MGKRKRFKLRSQEQMKDELSQISGEQERLEWFGQLVKDFDKADELNDLKHFRQNRRHEFDPYLLDRDCEDEISVPPQFKTLNNSDGWLDYIFSQRPEDLHELVDDEEVSEALRNLNSKRREALFYRVVHGYSTTEIAVIQGVSDRNVRKLYEKAMQEIRKQIDKQNRSN